MKIIHITGVKGSGKSTLAEMLNLRVQNSVVLNYADPLKEMVSKLFEISISDIEILKNNGLVDVWGNDSLLTSLSFRTVLQRMGTEVMRDTFGDDIWVEMMKDRIKRLPDHIEVVIIPDTRFDNEVLEGSTLVSVLRDGFVSDGHASETGVSVQPDIVVANNVGFDWLTLEASHIAREVNSFPEVNF